MRCFALAQKCQAVGGTAAFVVTAIDAGLEQNLKTERMPVYHISGIPGSIEDSEQTVSLASKLGVHWVVADGYSFDAEYQQRIKYANYPLLLLDDYGHANHYLADFVLNQNPSANESQYSSRELYTRLLLGADYVLIRQQFRDCGPWERKTPQVAKNILVTLGGSDPVNATLKVVKAMQQLHIDDLHVTVVVGASNMHYNELQLAVQSLPQIQLEKNATNMPELMAWADLAVTAGGSTCWELAFMGLPSLIITLADNQEDNARFLDSDGIAEYIGPNSGLTPDDIAGSLVHLIGDVDRRATMAQRGQMLIHSGGPERILRELNKSKVTFRKVCSQDCRLIWEWANDPITRSASFSSKQIPWEDHLSWFQAKLNDPQCIFLVAIDVNTKPIGQVRYQIENHVAVVSIALAPNDRGRGYGRQILSYTTQNLFSNGLVDQIHAYVKPSNTASIHAFTKAGFMQKGIVEVQDQLAIDFMLQKDDVK
jgi:UDP-2,4-diacetamido-2,4,6-trideoxy-beta-L-altropyranose hydrolase